jgi:hypothetical protein
MVLTMTCKAGRVAHPSDKRRRATIVARHASRVVRLGWILFPLAVPLLPMHAAVSPTRGGQDDPLQICLVAGDRGAAAFAGALRQALTEASAGATVTLAQPHADRTLALDPLRSAQAAIFVHGPGPLSQPDAVLLQEFLSAGRGCVVLGATADAWTAEPRFMSEYLGATPNGSFGKGAPMAVINLLPHPIYTGVARFETPEPMASWQKLADDAQIIMEGTVAEETAPLAWLRRLPAGRICHLVPCSPALFDDPAYVQIVANAVRWSASRAIPHAQPIVQRTFMPESYPGSFAITFPRGPTVCLDPVRGGINFISDGDYVDLRPRWLTKQGAPARVFGSVFYQEKSWQPLRAGSPARESKFEFRGYTLKPDGPEFHYAIDGREVHESLAATADGLGVVRRFRVGAGNAPLWLNLDPQPDATVVLTGLEHDGPNASFGAKAGGEFTIEIRRKAVALP